MTTPLSPWLTVGRKVDGAVTSADALHQTGLDWTVTKQPLYARKGSRYTTILDRWCVQRDRDGRVLGTVGSDYEPSQNTEAFAFMDPALGDGTLSVEAAGELFLGSRVWVMARMSDFSVLGDQAYHRYLLLVNSHDGSRALQASVVPVRVSANAVESMSLHGASLAFRATRRGSVSAKNPEVSTVLREAESYTSLFTDQAEALAKTRVSHESFDKALHAVFPDQKRQLSSNLQHVHELRGASPHVPDDLRETAFGALSAFTEWTNWGKTYRTEEARMKSLLWGWSRNAVSLVADSLLEA